MSRRKTDTYEEPFGPTFARKEKPLPVLTIRRGDRSHSLVIRPWLTFVCATLLLLAAGAYLGATAYLLFRDDVILASRAQSVRVQENYEDRIAELRKHIDRITSRQLLEQNVFTAELEELAKNQAQISQNNDRLLELINSFGGGNLRFTFTPVPKANPRRALTADDEIITGTIPENGSQDAPADGGEGGPYFPLIDAVRSNLSETHGFHLALLNAISVGAQKDLGDFHVALAPLGVRLEPKVPEDLAETGGPLEPIASAFEAEFFRQYQRAVTSVAKVDSIRQAAQSLPLWVPVESGTKVTSKYGPRLDPFLKKPAMHHGVDFRAKTGAPVYASANGVVKSAGTNGGYGRAIDIGHSRGLTTRYAHLSRIVVEKGQSVKRGQIIGYAGSTGRSTGPHLHFEIRKGGVSTNPLAYLTAGRKMRNHF